MIEIISGITTALVVIILIPLLSKHISARLIAATILCSMAFIYVGFSLKDNTVSSVVLEVLMAVAFYCIAIIGYSKNNYLIAIGIALHGTWDLFHHNGLLVKTDIPDYWPLYCSVTDFVWGAYFFLVFKRQKKQNKLNPVLKLEL
ncbi:MAG: hypothetical protein JWQ40_2259 [Segetibacter sp.]|nr:hypothetical protein [Segetibacter sp.]